SNIRAQSNGKNFSPRCDLKTELEKIKIKIYEEFVVRKNSPIYDPEEFESFCSSAGAHNLFQLILGAISSDRYSKERISINKKKSCFP
ncbi:hypothetical protein QZH41_012903, partial [Actinostola sp. cb2023]